MAIRRSNALDERILEQLAEGALVTVLCRDDAMPSIRQLQRWRKDDTEFDDRCWSAEGQGLMVQRSSYIEQMMKAIEAGGPGSSIQIQGLRELLHENGRTAGKLVSRMNDRVRVDANVEHRSYVISWADDPASDHVLINDGRDYVDVPKRQPGLVEANEKAMADG
jgi:hypothetical protein